MSTANKKFSKLFISLRYYLLGASKFDDSFKIALEALEFAKDIHTGFRKDGFTPEFQHQLEIAHLIRTLNVHQLAITIAVVLLHDVLEDYSEVYPYVTYQQLLEKFGKTVADCCLTLAKVYKGVKIDNAEYYTNITNCPICSIAKGADRVHNQSSMAHVFTREKQSSYVKETDDFVLPMLKEARRKFFIQEAAYENLKFILNTQKSFVTANEKERNETTSC